MRSSPIFIKQIFKQTQEAEPNQNIKQYRTPKGADAKKTARSYGFLVYYFEMVELQGLKPWTSSMPWKRSNQLSYSPI